MTFTEKLVANSPKTAPICAFCGYDLRGLDQHGNCPECGRGVLESMSPDLLIHADPKWLRRVTAGITGMAAVSAISLLNMTLYIMFADRLDDWRGWAVIAYSWLPSYAIALAAMWLLTTPQPYHRDGRWDLIGMSLRISFVVLVIGWLAMMFRGGHVSSVVILIWQVLLNLAISAEAVLYFLYLRHLADRMRDGVAVRTLFALMWLNLAGVIFLYVVPALSYFAELPIIEKLLALYMPAYWSQGVVDMALLVLLWRMRVQMKDIYRSISSSPELRE